MKTIEQQLAELTDNFQEKETAVKCHTIEEKQAAMTIFRQYYDIVEPSDVTAEGDERPTWQINCASPKKINENYITEAEGEDDLDTLDDNKQVDDTEDNEFDNFDVEDVEEPDTGDDFDMDLSQFDDPSDPLDMADDGFDTIDDISEVEKADKLTILKKRASDLSKKWQDIYKQINSLAKSMDLIASYDEDFNIKLEKADGTKSEYEQDLKDMQSELTNAESDDVDDDFGPSKYDARAAQYNNQPEPAQNESLDYKPQVVNLSENINYQNSNILVTNPGEIPISADAIDDDF